MYNSAKSCILMSGKTSGYFACETGVRQGENLSPLLLSIFLSDLRDNLSTYVKLGVYFYLLMYFLNCLTI